MSSSRGFSSQNCSQLFATLLPSFRQIAQKMKKKSGCHIFETPEIPPLTPIHVLFFGTSITVKNQGLILPFYFFSCSKGLEKKSCGQILNFYGILGGWGPKGRSQWFFMDFFDFVVEFLGK